MNELGVNPDTDTRPVQPLRQEANGSTKTNEVSPPAETTDSGASHSADTHKVAPRRQEAKAFADTTTALPPAETTDSGASGMTDTRPSTPRRRRARTSLTTKPDTPFAETTDSGANTPADTSARTPRRQEAISIADTTMCPPPADSTTATCLRLAELQRVRLFCITSQSRCDRSIESAIARCLGFSADANEAERKAVFKQAAAIRTRVEKGQHHDALPPDDPRAQAIADFIPLIPLSAQARAIWDEKRELVEKTMREMARTLPAFEWVQKHARGVGDLGMARIVGEAPLIGFYKTHERLWKRLGLAVIGGERQQKKSAAEEALLHGYSPNRRAEVWSVCSDTMLRAQWRRGSDPDGPGAPCGPFGEVYRARKAHTFERIAATEELPFSDRAKWTRKRCDSDARRVMSKEFLRDLWRVWRGLPSRHEDRWAQKTEEAA